MAPKKLIIKMNPLRSNTLSRKTAQRLTSKFHTLNHRLEILTNNTELSITSNKKENISENKNIKDSNKKDKTNVIKQEEINEIKLELQKLGGRKVYQDASLAAVSYFNSNKYVFQTLTKFNLRPIKKQEPLHVLEVGAINLTLHVPWLKVDGIDLLSRHPNIKQIDFFDYNIPEKSYFAIVNSMVLNSFPCPLKRGKMLRMCYSHLKDNGLLFLNLPIRCLKSRYLNKKLFLELMSTLGFELFDEKETPKIIFMCFKKVVSLLIKRKRENENDTICKNICDIKYDLFPNNKFLDPPKEISKYGTDFAITFPRFADV